MFNNLLESIPRDKAACEAAEIVAARSREAVDQMNKMGGRK